MSNLSFVAIKCSSCNELLGFSSYNFVVSCPNCFIKTDTATFQSVVPVPQQQQHQVIDLDKEDEKVFEDDRCIASYVRLKTFIEETYGIESVTVGMLQQWKRKNTHEFHALKYIGNEDYWMVNSPSKDGDALTKNSELIFEKKMVDRFIKRAIRRNNI